VVWYRGYLISADGLGWCIVYRMHSNGTGECVGEYGLLDEAKTAVDTHVAIQVGVPQWVSTLVGGGSDDFI